MDFSQDGGSITESAATPTSRSSMQIGVKKSIIDHHGNIDIKECVKKRIFPVAKFLRQDDLPYAETSSQNSWCRKMVSWCNIDENQVALWWGPARKLITTELCLQRSTKTNKIKTAFFGKQPASRASHKALPFLMTSLILHLEIG